MRCSRSVLERVMDMGQLERCMRVVAERDDLIVIP
jgi:hypothetical protein